MGQATGWPNIETTQRSGVSVVTINRNTMFLTSLLAWSLFRILRTGQLRDLVVVDNGSDDGSRDLLRGLDQAGLCHLLANEDNPGHGSGLNQAISYLAQEAQRRGKSPAWIWVLDSDCCVARPDALASALEAARRSGAAVVGESEWDPWRQTDRFGLHCLLLDPVRAWQPPLRDFDPGGDPSYAFLSSCAQAGLVLTDFPFLAAGYVIHRGRGSLAHVKATNEVDNPLYDWAVGHHEAHFGGIDGAAERHEALIARFQHEVTILDAAHLVTACQSTPST